MAGVQGCAVASTSCQCLVVDDIVVPCTFVQMYRKRRKTGPGSRQLMLQAVESKNSAIDVPPQAPTKRNCFGTWVT